MYTCTKCKNINIYIHITYYTNVNECIIISSIIPEYCCCDTHSHLSPPCVSLLPVWLISLLLSLSLSVTCHYLVSLCSLSGWYHYHYHYHYQSLVTTLCLSAPCLADIRHYLSIPHTPRAAHSLSPHCTDSPTQHNDTDTDQAYSVTHSHHQASSVTLCSESPLFCSCYCHSTLHITALFKIFWISSSNILLHCIHCVMCFIIKVYDLQTIKFYNIIENWANIKKFSEMSRSLCPHTSYFLFALTRWIFHQINIPREKISVWLSHAHLSQFFWNII